MASDDKKTKTILASKSETTAKKAIAEKEKNEVVGGEKAADSPSGYSRGEGQKPVSKAYKENWNTIYAKKKKKR